MLLVLERRTLKSRVRVAVGVPVHHGERRRPYHLIKKLRGADADTAAVVGYIQDLDSKNDNGKSPGPSVQERSLGGSPEGEGGPENRSTSDSACCCCHWDCYSRGHSLQLPLLQVADTGVPRSFLDDRCFDSSQRTAE